MSEMTFVPAFINNSAPQSYGVAGCCNTPYPHQLCDRCKSATGIQTNVLSHNNDDDGPLRLPAINWAQPPEQHIDTPPASWGSTIDPPATARPFVTNNSTPKHDDEPLRLPVVNWAAE